MVGQTSIVCRTRSVIKLRSPVLGLAALAVLVLHRIRKHHRVERYVPRLGLVQIVSEVLIPCGTAAQRRIYSTSQRLRLRSNPQLKRAITALTAGQLPDYVRNQIFTTNQVDPTFGERRHDFFGTDGEDETDVRLAKFDGPAFQQSAGPLVGCTVVIIVSKRAVYMVSVKKSVTTAPTNAHPRDIFGRSLAGSVALQALPTTVSPGSIDRLLTDGAAQAASHLM